MFGFLKNKDWKNLDWKALAASNITRGVVTVIIGAGVAITGHTINPQTTQLATDSLMHIIANAGDFVALGGAIYALMHRAVAQPETLAVIVPKKDVPPIPPTT